MSKIKTSRNRKTCSVFGCMNSNLQNPDMAFFSLPSDPQRLASWLSLMDREDLANKPERHYRVCEIHFDKGCIMLTSNRKVLKKNSLPSLHLPVTARLEKGVQTPRALLPVVLRLNPGGGGDAADPANINDVTEDTSLYCEEGTAARGRGALLDAAGNAVGNIQEGFQCNVCNADILKFRYTCVQCADYDLCAACEARGAHAQHYVLRVPGARPYAETQAVLSRIRQQLLGAGPDNAALSDSLKIEIKLETEDPLDTGPDPLQHADATERQDKDVAPLQTEIGTILETFEPVHVGDTKRAEQTNKQAHMQAETDCENTAVVQHLFLPVPELTTEAQKIHYLERPSDEDLPLRHYTELSAHNVPKKRQFLEQPTEVVLQKRQFIEQSDDVMGLSTHHMAAKRQFTERSTDQVPDKRQFIEQIDVAASKRQYIYQSVDGKRQIYLCDDGQEKRQYAEQSKYVSEQRQIIDKIFEASTSPKTEDRGYFGVEIYTHTSRTSVAHKDTKKGFKSTKTVRDTSKDPSKKDSAAGASESRRLRSSRINK